MAAHCNIHKEAGNTFPPSRSNQISREYYWHLVGEINRGTLKSAVCRIEDQRFGTQTFHLLTRH